MNGNRSVTLSVKIARHIFIPISLYNAENIKIKPKKTTLVIQVTPSREKELKKEKKTQINYTVSTRTSVIYVLILNLQSRFKTNMITVCFLSVTNNLEAL